MQNEPRHIKLTNEVQNGLTRKNVTYDAIFGTKPVVLQMMHLLAWTIEG